MLLINWFLKAGELPPSDFWEHFSELPVLRAQANAEEAGWTILPSVHWLSSGGWWVKINPAAEFRESKSRGDYSMLSLISKRKCESWETREKLNLHVSYYFSFCYFFITSLAPPPRKLFLTSSSKKKKQSYIFSVSDIFNYFSLNYLLSTWNSTLLIYIHILMWTSKFRPCQLLNKL